MLRATCRTVCVAALLWMPRGAQAQSAVGTTAPSAVAGAYAPPVAPGVDAAIDSARAVRGQTLAISVLTYGPGNEVFERFGHVALEVSDTVNGPDIAYNWGMFSFQQKGFLVRFLTGDTRYWMEGFNTADFNAAYMRMNRSIRRQRLGLTPVERAAILEYVLWNSREENRYYRYDYYNDNCSTRIRDVLDWALRGRLKPALMVAGSGRTWRSETERVFAAALLPYAGIEIALGQNADVSLTKWQQAFLPEQMAADFQTVVLRNADNRRYRLVVADTQLHAASRPPLPGEPPDRVMMAALIGLFLAGSIAVLADGRAPGSHLLLALGVSAWYLIGGVLGTLLLLAGTVTRHAPYMGHNTTVLLLHPLLLIASVVVPISLWRRTTSASARGSSALAAVFALVALLLQAIPATRQHSGVVLAVVVPVHLAIAIATWRLPRGSRLRA